MIFTYYPNDFWHKRKIYDFDPYDVLLAIATNIPVRLETGFVVQGHIWSNCLCGFLVVMTKYLIVVVRLGLHTTKADTLKY